MPRDIPVGNGRLLVAFDKAGLIRDFYFPHVGLENHASDAPFRIGVMVDGRFSWLPDGWEVSRDYLDDSLVTDVRYTSRELGVTITSNDLVDFHEDVYLKRVTVSNTTGHPIEVRLFFCHSFRIYGSGIGDTAAYRPELRGLLHYKNERYFLINACANNKCGLDYYATGDTDRGGMEGTWRDAEDGELSGNPIAQGSVDSVAGIHLRPGPGGEEVCYYWICAGRGWDDVERMNSAVIRKKPQTMFKRTFDYWNLWVNKERTDLSPLGEKVARLYKRSLLVIRTQIDDCGSIIAANDSDVVKFNRDTYSYMWPRDAALVSYALDLAGYTDLSRGFFKLCGDIIKREGYFMHKYTPSGTLASSWHPWQKDGEPQLPIQEDETALVVWALWEHFKKYRDIEFIKPLYRPLIISAADFMMNYRDPDNGLPLPSYDLWEERRGVLTFTASAVYGGLTAAASFADAFGESELAASYRRGAARLREGMDRHLYMEKEARFARMVNFGTDGGAAVDPAIDASLYGIFAFGAYPPDDPRVRSTMLQVKDALWCRTKVGGIARYAGDSYHRVSGELPGNPWFVTTLWLAQYYIASAEGKEGLDNALGLMEWVAERALASGILAEQVNPYTDEPLSVSPLTWSHATFVIAVHEYLNRLAVVETCDVCGLSRHPAHR